MRGDQCSTWNTEAVGTAPLAGGTVLRRTRHSDCSTWNILPLPLTVASRRYRHMTPRKVIDGQGCAEGARYLSLGRTGSPASLLAGAGSPRTPRPNIPRGLKARAKIQSRISIPPNGVTRRAPHPPSAAAPLACRPGTPPPAPEVAMSGCCPGSGCAGWRGGWLRRAQFPCGPPRAG
jgi:hypothetical protein